MCHACSRLSIRHELLGSRGEPRIRITRDHRGGLLHVVTLDPTTVVESTTRDTRMRQALATRAM